MVCWGLVEKAMQNAQARLQNSTIRLDDMWAQLAVVRKEDGEPGSLYPADLQMYLKYDVEKVQSLLKEYGLDYQEGESKEALCKRFLQYIGVKVDFEMIDV
ncbi:hypothetical protein AMATHDRAFT_57435 [Amanita thiersii Skay4041]|uniref:Uncharacterized protein n=1 Tax=Amanita thiersii Skay4041 TaxID=703135 RepID=A0A2A9NRZ0_9AGAR|nr:hypothetical protein AMATHDRAFT_57435 [Amanita thiersii Skay4041]